ncbi:hypothetical protein TVAG_142460 [Trichomonas vaginalis G3]|uniref:DUF3447 domain-containing protein n=1 Tax=Trichomonas vaginalis (strain ATCC PRA-98 / G3) TaxID=412133 RepID=A2EHK5_TRIV3|nr:spectrin binding [Trichomonas vaginalis G3]EAY07892.1 hypothetical protein TVAG_142460 [Trichomonas vaginalis G3]KAI5514151.1 spectrin binding [Trichomonas vaginalis G3]|eukprot:XP_001320115.1 hypothetical protein [Trichomonas vaginalis G3]
MSNQQLPNKSFDELVMEYKDYIDVFDSLFKLNTHDPDYLLSLYQQIKTVLIEKYCFYTDPVLSSIDDACDKNNKYVREYWKLFKMICDEFQVHFTDEDLWSDYFTALISVVYGVKWYVNDFFTNQTEEELLNIHRNFPILEYTMNDDIMKFKEYITEHGFDPKETYLKSYYHRWNLLEFCAYYGSVNIWKFLLSNFKIEISKKCLELAFFSGNVDIINDCTNAGIEPNDTCRENAIASHRIESIEYLNERYGFDVNIMYVTYYYNLRYFLKLLDTGFDIDMLFNYSPVFCIPNLCQHLIDKRADIHKSFGDSTFRMSSKSMKMRLFLIEKGVEIDKMCIFPAAFNNYPDQIKLLHSHGVDINMKNKYGETPLHLAAKNNSYDALKTLIELGADLKVKDNLGYTPFDVAKYESFEILSKYEN